MYVNGDYFCDTLEDTDRGLCNDMNIKQIKEAKVYGQTAIPTGVYNISKTYSNKFKRVLPLVNDVKGFEGIRIHKGNTPEHTLGCILIGENKVKGKVINSTPYEKKLMEILNEDDEIELTIE